jgi:hypothetical protein
MDARCSVLGPVDVHSALVELNLMPLQVAQLGRSQAVTVGNQDHRCIAMSVAAAFTSTVHQRLDLALGEVLPNCTVYSVRCVGIGYLIFHDKSYPLGYSCKHNAHFLYSLK